MVNNLIFEQDMRQPVRERQLSGSLIEGSNKGVRISCYVYRNGVAETLTGDIKCTVLDSAGNEVFFNGSRSGNLAYANIPSSALQAGIVRLVMWDSGTSNVRTPILILSGVVAKTLGAEYIDSGSVIPSLSNYTSYTENIQDAASVINRMKIEASLVTENSDRYKCEVTRRES